MTASESNEDEDAARDWDRRRFFRLLTANWPDGAITSPMDVIAAMSEEDRAETLSIIDRLGNPFEDPENIRHRQKELLDYAHAEPVLRDFIDNRNLSEATRNEAREVLALMQRNRAELTDPGD